MARWQIFIGQFERFLRRISGIIYLLLSLVICPLGTGCTGLYGGPEAKLKRRVSQDSSSSCLILSEGGSQV